MFIETLNFGKLEVDEDKVIFFKEGIPAFEDETEFVIILNEDAENPFHYLQSIKTPELSFVIANPFELFGDYDIVLPEIAINKLNIKDENEVLVYSIVVVPEDISKMTVNLAGPIVINIEEKLGKQVVLDDNRYSTKELIFKDSSQEGGK